MWTEHVSVHAVHGERAVELYANKKAVTYPTLGRPTIPIFSEVPNLPISGGGFGASSPFP